MQNESRSIKVQCECPSAVLSAPSLEETLAIVGAASVATHGRNPFPIRSSIQTKDCAACEGTGYRVVPNGPDDIDKELCGACNGSGRVVANH